MVLIGPKEDDACRASLKFEDVLDLPLIMREELWRKDIFKGARSARKNHLEPEYRSNNGKL